jgi:plastocyanin
MDSQKEEKIRQKHVWALVGIALSVGLTACAGPQTSRSGEIHTVKIEQEPHPADLIVNIGDEVRWVNHRTLPVRLDLVGDVHEGLSCERGFSNFLGMKTEEATIKPSESVAACFSKVGVIKYNLRMDSALQGGKTITSGTVQIGDPAKR